jgi:ribulose-phosphate 3-epimerase
VTGLATAPAAAPAAAPATGPAAGPAAEGAAGAATMRIAPSILAADFARLGQEAAAVADAADWLHVDVMDGHFVPNLTIGLPVVEALLKHAGLPLDCHLMIEEPDRWAPGYAEAGAGSVTIHAEAAMAPVRTLRAIRSAGARAGLAVNPATPVEPYAGLLPEIDMLLLMTVEPGFGGQPFLDMVLPKLARARELVTRHGISVWLQVDGGVTEETIGRCAEAGADVFVAGSAVYRAGDPGAAVRSLREAAARAGASPRAWSSRCREPAAP